MQPNVRIIEQTREINVGELLGGVPGGATAAADEDAAAVLRVDGRAYAVPPHGGVVGRRPDCAVRIEHPGVSRRHLSLRPMADGSWLLHDLGSTNGVWVNGERVAEPRLIGDGDVIGIGRVEAQFETKP